MRHLAALGLVLLLPVLPLRAETILDERTGELVARITLSEAGATEPGLRDFLEVEAMATFEQYRELAAEAAREARAKRQPFRPFRLEIRDEDRFVSADYLSLLRVISDETGGAHAMTFLEPLTLDRRTGTFLRLDDFLAGPEGGRALDSISRHLRGEIIRRHHGGDSRSPFAREIAAATVPDVTVLQNFTLVPSTEPGRIGGLAFHFAPSDVAPHAAGPVEIVVPLPVFAAGLRPAIAARFGGEPRPR